MSETRRRAAGSDGGRGRPNRIEPIAGQKAVQNCSLRADLRRAPGLRACLRQGTVIRIQPAKQRVPGRKSNGACVGLASDKEGEFTLADFTSVFGPVFRVPLNPPG